MRLSSSQQSLGPSNNTFAQRKPRCKASSSRSTIIMHYSSFAQDAIITAVAALALAPTAEAHGHVKSISVGGTTYPGADPVGNSDLVSPNHH